MSRVQISMNGGRQINCIGFERAEVLPAEGVMTLTIYGGRWSERTNRRQLTEADDQIIVEMTEAGASNQEIADKLGVGRTSITARRRRMKLPAAQPGRSLPREAMARAEEMLNAGASYGMTYRETGLAVMTLRKYFPDKGFRPGGSPESSALNRNRLTAEQLASAKAMLDEEMSYGKAALAVGCTTHALMHHFPGMGDPRFRKQA